MSHRKRPTTRWARRFDAMLRAAGLKTLTEAADYLQTSMNNTARWRRGEVMPRAANRHSIEQQLARRIEERTQA